MDDYRKMSYELKKLATKHGVLEKIDPFALESDQESIQNWSKVLMELDSIKIPRMTRNVTLSTVDAHKFKNAGNIRQKITNELNEHYDFTQVKELLRTVEVEDWIVQQPTTIPPPPNKGNDIEAYVIDVDWENTNIGSKLFLYTRDIDSSNTTLFTCLFRDYFYVKVTDQVSVSAIKKRLSGYAWFLRTIKYKEAGINGCSDNRRHCYHLKDIENLITHYELVDNVRSVYGYQPTQQTFLKVFTVSPTVTKDLFSGVSKKNPEMEFFEAQTDYVNKFMTKVGISSCVPISVKNVCVSSQNEYSTCSRHCDLYDESQIIPLNAELYPVYSPRMMYFDIECISLDPNVFPSAEKCPIIQISYLLASGLDEIKRGVLCLKETPGNPIFESFEYEDQLLVRFAQIIQEFKPDALAGFNSNNFDMPYILDRMRVLDVQFATEFTRRKDYSLTYKRTFKQSKQFGTKEVITYVSPGLFLFDFFEVIKADVTKKLRSYSLKSICAEYLGDDNKEDLRYRDIPMLFETPEGRAKIASYCMKDTVLLLELDKKLMLGVNAWAMTRVLGTTVDVAINRGLVFKLMSKLKQYTERFNFLIPSFTEEQKPKFDGKYQGAFVLDPVVGFHEDPVVVLDYASLYPSLMIYYNLSYDTIVVDAKWAQENQDKLEYHNNVPFVKPEVHFGILPLLEQEMAKQRNAAKKMKAAAAPGSMEEAVYDGLQLANKVIMNSLYGMCGSPTATVPCVEIASTITGMGRENLMAAKEYVEKNFCEITGEPIENKVKVIYGDTDSIFIKMPNITIEKSIKYGKMLEHNITKDLYHRKNALVMEYEKVFCPLLLVTAKRYAGRKYEFDPNKYKMTTNGLQLVKRDTAILCVKTMGSFFDCIFKDNDKIKGANVVKDAITNLFNDNTPLEYFKLTKKISKKLSDYKTIPPHISAWQNMVSRLGEAESPSVGEMFDFIVTRIDKKTKGMGHAMVDFQYAEENNLLTSIDKTYYFNTFIVNPLKTPMEMILGPEVTADILNTSNYTRVETVVAKKGNILGFFGVNSVTTKRKMATSTQSTNKKKK